MTLIGRYFRMAVRFGYKFGNLYVPSCFNGAAVFISAPLSRESIIEDAPRHTVKEHKSVLLKWTSNTDNIHNPISIVNSAKSKENVSHAIEHDGNNKFESLNEQILLELSKNNHNEVQNLIQKSKQISEGTLRKLFAAYSENGSVKIVLLLQKYCEREHPEIYMRNCQFLHYAAKAHCMNGNAESGLSILSNAYRENSSNRNVYRTIFKDLIVDSVANRSTASLVIFKNYVVRWIEDYKECYPLVCLWHVCWASSWFSDQMLADELVDTQRHLRIIIQNRATIFSLTSLTNSENDDATIRLLQTLLRHNMMEAYRRVLETLFEFRVRRRDVQGCTEIIRNAKVLGLSLAKRVEERYILLVINRDVPRPTSVAPPQNFIYKF